ncbi:MAG: pseudouridine synthase [bacterium]|nr:pseudouridine synthase [bacterium]
MSKIRLQKFLSISGVTSRRKSEDLIRNGLIKLNGKIVTQMGQVVNEGSDIVEFDGKVIKPKNNLVYYILNKPKGYTSTCCDLHAKHTILELVPNNPRVFPVGRLDKDSRGLIILTNDGDLANKLTHPRYRHDKEYEVKTSIKNPALNSKADIIQELNQLTKGVMLDGKITQSAKIINTSINIPQKTVDFQIVLTEGRNRQIRRMTDLIGLDVTDLKRIRIGKITLNNIPEGTYRERGLNELI